LPWLISAFEHCSPLEAKFLVKIITSDLRIGLKEGLVEEAIAKAFNVSADEVRAANLLLGNIGETASDRRGKQTDHCGRDSISSREIHAGLTGGSGSGYLETIGRNGSSCDGNERATECVRASSYS
jgi:hypothetical protein